MREEENQTVQNASVVMNFDLYNLAGDFTGNASFSWKNDTMEICLGDITDQWLTYATIQYEGNATGYQQRSYYLINYTLTNVSQDLYLYLINDVIGSRITLTVMDSSGIPQPDHYVLIDRYYVAENAYKTVTVGKTDSSGQTVIYLEAYDTYYRFKIQDDTTVRQTVSSRLITASSITLVIEEPNIIEWFEYYDKVRSLCTFNETRRLTECVYNDTVGLATSVCLTSWHITSLQENKTCDNCSTIANGVLSCSYDLQQNGTHLWQLRANVTLNPVEFLTIDNGYVEMGIANIFGLVGLLVGFILIGTVTFTGLWHPPVAIILLVASLAMTVYFGLVMFSLEAIIGIAFIGAIIIFRSKS